MIDCPTYSRECRANFCVTDMPDRDRTGWLGRQDSNLEMPFRKMPFEMSGSFRLISERLGTRDFSPESCPGGDMHLQAELAGGCQTQNRSLPEIFGYQAIEPSFQKAV